MRASIYSVAPLLIAIAATAGCFRTDFPTACNENEAECEDNVQDSSSLETSAEADPPDTVGDVAIEDTSVGLDATDGSTMDADEAGLDSGSDSGSPADSSPVDAGADTSPVDTGLPDTGMLDAGVDTAPVCVANSYSCVGNELRQCKSDGTGVTTLVTCPAGTCSASAGRCTFCVPGALSCSGTQPTKCDTLGAAFVANGAACVAPKTCGGGGTAGVCGCTPTATSTLCAGKECGSVDNGCGTTVSCGSCAAPRTCGGGGTAFKCGGCSGSLPGPTMIDAGGFCIDTTEITQAQYQAFLAAKGTDFSGQPALCAGRPYAVGSGPGCTWSPGSTPTIPVTCVDWCKANAYCKWAGKRLCGKIGGGATPMSDFASTTVDQWYKACTVNGSVYWPYGGSPDSTACVSDSTRSSPAVVKSKSTCVGPFPPFDGLYDMSGNVAEWTDSCGTLTSGPFSGEYACRLRGGNYSSTTYQTACNADSAMPWAFNSDQYGIRCCAD